MLLKDRIVQHYDELSPFYRDIWGVHIHHGYFDDPAATKEKAQERLIEELAARAGIEQGCRILDVGCGMGGSAIHLSRTRGARVTGITISPVQVEIGNALAGACGADVRLLRMDAEAVDVDALTIDGHFDVVWSVEAISHMGRRGACIRGLRDVLKPGGRLVIADWFRAPALSGEEERRYLAPIQEAMLVPALDTADTYARYAQDAGITVTNLADLSAEVAKTWDLGAELIKNPSLWKFAATRGRDFMAFLEGFAAMRAGYKAKALVYGALIGRKS